MTFLCVKRTEKGTEMSLMINCSRRTTKWFLSRNVIPMYIQRFRQVVDFLRFHHFANRPKYSSKSHGDSSMRESQNLNILLFSCKNGDKREGEYIFMCFTKRQKIDEITLRINPNYCYHFDLHCVCLSTFLN